MSYAMVWFGLVWKDIGNRAGRLGVWGGFCGFGFHTGAFNRAYGVAVFFFLEMAMAMAATQWQRGL
jgi:hypothetical protein